MGSLCSIKKEDWVIAPSFDSERYLGTWFELPVPRGKEKRFPKVAKKLVLRQKGEAELENTAYPNKKPYHFDYTVIDTDYSTYAIIVSKTNLMVSEMFMNDLQFLWVLTRTPLEPKSEEWFKISALANKAVGAFRS